MPQIDITLRATEEDSFVVGYPGIPACAGRTQASVKGTAELRVLPDVMDKVEAKWVRIELKKFETVVQGGVTRSFEEGVGPRYTTLWSSSETKGYGLLVTQDFPFNIRLPESIPPSLESDDGVGIRYELVASACIKGKGGLLRRGKPVVVTTTSPITIQKHELNSTWPAYNTPEVFEAGKRGFKFTVQRNQQCFGPGDRITATTTLTSDIAALRTNVVVQDFETTLKEVMTLNIPNTPVHRRETVIARNKIVMNAGVEAGTPFFSDVTCVVPPDYTLATLNALSSRHINISYSFCVKVALNKMSISLEFPVIISNIERHDSLRWVNNIGTVPGLSDSSPSRSRPTSSLSTESYQQSIRRSSCSSVQQENIFPAQSTQQGHVALEPLHDSRFQAGDGASSPRPESPASITTTPSSSSTPLSPATDLSFSPPSSRRSSTETRMSRLQVMGPRPLPTPPAGVPHPRRTSLPAQSSRGATRTADQIGLNRRTWPGPASHNSPSMIQSPLAFPALNPLNFLDASRLDTHAVAGTQFTSSAAALRHSYTTLPEDLLQQASSPVDTTNDERMQMQEHPTSIELAYDEPMVINPSVRLSTQQRLYPLLPELVLNPLSNFNGDIKDQHARYPTSIQVLSNIENQPLHAENGLVNADIPYARMPGYSQYSTDGDDEDIYDDPSPEYSSSENLSSPQTRSSSPQSVDIRSETTYTSSVLTSSSQQSLQTSPTDAWWSCASGYEPSYSSSNLTGPGTASICDSSESNLSLNDGFIKNGPSSVRETDTFNQYLSQHGMISVSPEPQAMDQEYRRRDSTFTQVSVADEDDEEENPPDYFTSMIMAYYFNQTSSI